MNISLKQKLLTGAVIGAGLVGSVLSGEKAGAGNFYDFCYPRDNPKSVISFLDSKQKIYDNLMYRTDPNDASGQSDVLVSKEGYYTDEGYTWVGEIWDMAFLKRLYNDKKEFTGWGFVGYANNDNIYSNKNNSTNGSTYHLDGWLGGEYYNNYGMMPVGTKPDDIFLVNDKNGDGVGSVSGGNWTLGSDDTLYHTSDILFASGPQKTDFVRGDTSRLPTYPYVEVLPNMVVSPRRPGDAIYKNGERIDREGILDLINLSSHW
ncbi:MAG TPA: hypothetical protein ENN87_02520, partial [Phycisphaerales bacterium]|nr:hypothetical protein [Phycisphaerales bacterium]